MLDENGKIRLGSLHFALQQRAALAMQMHANLAGDTWSEIGPTNLMGRSLALLGSPSNPNLIYMATAGGGVWKSTNGGTTWAPIGDSLGSLTVSSLAFDPTNEQVLFAGTGEGYFNGDAIQGDGLYKSSDGGVTWSVLPGTSGFGSIDRIAVDPSNHQNILISVAYGGIYQSLNGGQTWSPVHGAQGGVSINFSSADHTKVVATVLDYDFNTNNWFNEVIVSTNGGTTWSAGGLLLDGFDTRMEAKFVPGSSTTILMSVATNGGVVYKSTDGGATFNQVTTSGGSGASWYSNDIWIDPTNPNRVAVAGTYVYGSTNGGATLTQISNGYIMTQQAHPDAHAFMAPSNYDGVTHKTLYVSTDGGVYKAADITTANTNGGWTNCDQTARTAQFYSIGGDGKAGIIFGGTQDNGTLAVSTSSSASASLTFGGDGGYVAMDPTNTNYIYGEYIDLEIFRSTSGALNSNGGYITSGLGDAGSNANFIAPFIMDPNSPTTLLAGGASLWRCTNAKSANPTWSSIRSPGSQNISAIAVAPGNSNIIWVGQNDGTVAMTANGTAASPTWTTISSGSPLPARTCTRLLVDPANSNVVYATFGGFSANNVWKTTNGGTSWQSITGSLPQAPVYAIARNPGAPNTLYVGTEIGIFSTSDGGQSWTTSNDGPNAAEVDDLEYLNNSTQLVAGTHGRGIWILTTGAAALSNFTLNPASVVGGKSSTGTVSIPKAAPSGGTTVAISLTGSSSASAPASVTIAAGATSATFAVTTTPVSTVQSANLTVTVGSSSLSATLAVQAPPISSLKLAHISIEGGSTDTATVTIGGPAPAGGLTVQLSSGSNLVVVPKSVSIAAGATTGTFSVSTSAVLASTPVSITASYGSSSISSTLTLIPTTIKSISVSPLSVIGGSTTAVSGKVTLGGQAPTGGLIVSLSSSAPSIASVPASVTVAAGATTATFSVTSKLVTSSQNVVLKAATGTASTTAKLIVNPFVVYGVTLSPTTVTGGTSSSCTVKLNATLASGAAVTVKLSSGSTAATVPSTLKITGAVSGTFTVSTTPVAANTVAAISGSLNGGSKSANLTIKAPVLTSFTISPTSVKGSSATVVTGTVKLSGPAPAGGMAVSLASSSSSASVPASVTVAAGATSGTFTLSQHTVTASIAVTITTTLGTVSKTAKVTVTP